MISPFLLRCLRARIPSAKALAWFKAGFNPTRADCLQAGWSDKQIERYFAVPESDVDQDLCWLEHSQHHIVPMTSADYPYLLQQIADPPLALFVMGDPTILAKPQLAMVGSRNPSAAGRETAYAFAESLAAMGLVITSGLALGIDAASHQGALAAKGQTIAVLGTGVDRVYPAKHHQLAQQIVAKGVVISEFPLGTTAQPHHFPERNRIISGLSLGVLVVEAALQSGSLITARQALDQGREVFAIPGSIHNPLARGCHYLLKNGAKLVENAQDILEELGSLAAVLQTVDTQEAYPALSSMEEEPLDEVSAAMLAAIDYSPTTIEQIVVRTGMNADTVASTLLMLELSGTIFHEAGGYRR